MELRLRASSRARDGYRSARGRETGSDPRTRLLRATDAQVLRREGTRQANARVVARTGQSEEIESRGVLAANAASGGDQGLAIWRTCASLRWRASQYSGEASSGSMEAPSSIQSAHAAGSARRRSYASRIPRAKSASPRDGS